ncbi:LysR family transcriptional regulator [Leeia sp. TBRC 13508]|uniref:LysR family transcriptional regulator n=1 Tax=Leeia speluncae TaxID=2884804 RepID=A0ABS8D4C4_9NEIS|nr:LysR family transcriptional regulator [Leeia speluncae]MCB6183038.1 LysR family transcriptional regulator [Leeia speluncae]
MRLDDLELFVLAADQGSFSLVARQLNITPAFVSGAIMRLEKHLGTRLFVRNTRNLRLSEEGLRYLPFARGVVDQLQQGAQVLSEQSEALKGTLRLSAPSDIGRNLLVPWLDDFQTLHPQLAIQLRISDRAVDLVGEPVDAAIRYGQLPDSSLIAWPLVNGLRRSLCAAPAYLAKFGTPTHPTELVHHNCLGFVWGDQTFQRWRFTLPEEECVVNIRGNRFSDDADIVRRWAVNGQGLVYKSRLDLLPDIQAGRLVEVFPPTWGEPTSLHLVAAHRLQATPAVQALKAWLQEKCQALIA